MSRRHRLRGLATRLASASVGATLAAGMILVLPSPVSDPASTFLPAATLGIHTTSVETPPSWPTKSSAAVVVPALAVAADVHDHVAPIASLTKLMTAYVVLQKLPLSLGESGPCLTVNAADVAYYEAINAQGESDAAVAVGERLCENQLLAGLLVHSAGNFAVMLANLAWGSPRALVAHMNEQAHAMGLLHTHYADVAGIDSDSVSTALEQGELAAALMQSPVVRAIVDQPSVTLPVAGTLSSYTPYVGVDGVVGVKSGRTDAAGGCDVMAMRFTLGTQPQLAYVVILGARGGDLLTPAGNQALVLARSVVASLTSVTLRAGTPVGTIGWDNERVNVVTTQAVTLFSLGAFPSTSVRAHVFVYRGELTRGTMVGFLTTSTGARVPLTVAHALTPLTRAERLR